MQRPLINAYPELKKQLPFLALATLPTELAPLNKINANLWIKNDGKSGELYGGNKVRKLEFILGKIKHQGRKNLITFGAIGTNHGVAIALYCQQQGIECTVLLFDQPLSKTVQQNLRTMHLAGATLIHCGSLWRTVLRFYSSQRLRTPQSVFLFAGGSSIEGCIAFVNAAFELKQQVDAGLMPCPDFIVCAVGSAGTIAGLNLGCTLAGLPTRVIGVRVAPSHLGIIPSCTTKTIGRLRNKTYRHLRKLSPSIPQLTLQKIELLDQYYGAGYGVETDMGAHASKMFSSENIQLEKTYTAKAAAAALELCQQEPKKTILYWHTYNSVPMNENRLLGEKKALPETLQRLLESAID